MSDNSLHGEKVTLRIPRDLVALLPSGKTLPQRIQATLWLLTDIASGRSIFPGDSDRVEAIEARLDALERERSSASSRRQAEVGVAVLDAIQALSDDLVRIQRTLVPLFRYIERQQSFGDKRTIDEIEDLLKRLSERNHRIIAEPRERLAARILDEEA